MAKYSEKQNKWTQDYVKRAYDTFNIRVPKGRKDDYKAKAEQLGKSLNQYIVDLIEADMGK